MFNNFSTISHNIMDPTWCTLTHQGLFKVPRAHQEAPWFGLGDLNMTNKTNNLPSQININMQGIIIPVTMFHWNWFMQDGYFSDRHCDNSKVIPDYNSSQIKFHLKIVCYYLSCTLSMFLFVYILLFFLHPYSFLFFLGLFVPCCEII